MSKKIRYLIIAFSFIFFVLTSPVIVLYVKGVTFDFESRKFYKTGILAIRAEPKTVNILINGKLAKTSEGNVKFLKPGGYYVALEKNGYQKWSKRLEIDSGQVTWANPENNKIFLFAELPENFKIDEGAKDFFSQNDKTYYLANNSLTIVTKNFFEKKETYDLPKPINLIKDFFAKDFLFLTQKEEQTGKLDGLILFDVKNKKFINFSDFIDPNTEIQVSPQNEIFFLKKDNLYKTDYNKTKTDLVDSNIKEFLFEGNNFYYIKNNGLFVSAGPNQEAIKIIDNLPEFNFAKIFVNFNKQVYLQLDDTLYKINSILEKLADNVININFNQIDSSMVIVSGSEILRTRQNKDKLEFITRSAETVKNPELADKIGYCLFIKNNKIIALELDARDKQNEFTLYQGKDVLKFEIDASGENITVLDGSELKNIKIR